MKSASYATITLPNGQVFRSPAYDTVTGFTLAKLIMGHEVNQLVFNQWDMTRLSSYIQDLEERGLQGWIYTRPLPLTKRQKRGKGGKPFSTYILDPMAIGTIIKGGGLSWAKRVLAWHDADRKVS
ncbi:MAG: hypothetical protein IBX55_16650 [Methyloprofundus sp.]|nr:hypothetical protein [Methyloprofundus sp.]